PSPGRLGLRSFPTRRSSDLQQYHFTMSYRNLQIWQLSRLLVIDIHNMSLNLPSFEKFEVGSQIRRSIKSVKSNIVEGYGRRRYRSEEHTSELQSRENLVCRL